MTAGAVGPAGVGWRAMLTDGPVMSARECGALVSTVPGPVSVSVGTPSLAKDNDAFSTSDTETDRAYLMTRQVPKAEAHGGS
jgi:hypothetical protein